ncbi:MAG: DUF434 domain-containing protein [Acidobacteriota bacterium]
MCPDRRQHRGAHPSDRNLFDATRLPDIRRAVADLSLLLSRGYAHKSSLKLVGDRYRLTERQRIAVSRAACADAQIEKRNASRVEIESLRDERVAIDGFNLLITLEAALSGGVIALCRDHCLRDLSSVHGSYRSVDETRKAILLVGEALEEVKPSHVKWFLDRPVSNSIRLAQKMIDLGAERGWEWEVEVLMNPDAALIESNAIAITSDSLVLDRVERWANLADHLISSQVADAWIIDLRP